MTHRTDATSLFHQLSKEISQSLRARPLGTLVVEPSPVPTVYVPPKHRRPPPKPKRWNPTRRNKDATENTEIAEIRNRKHRHGWKAHITNTAIFFQAMVLL